jgi:hypothetical protein
MSGSNQAVRLQGMLGNLADSFNGMGDAYNFVPNAIRNVTRPEVDSNSSESLMQYAQWAQRNGFDDEAKQYMALGYRQKEKESQEAKDAAKAGVMRDAINTGSEAMKLGEEGFLSAVDSRISGLRGQLNNTDDPTAIAEIQRQIDKLENKRGDFVIAADNENARRVVQLDETLARLDKTDPEYGAKKAALERVREDILSRGNAESAYNTQRLELMEGENNLRAARWEQAKPQIIAEALAAGTDRAKWENLEERYGEFSAELDSVKGALIDNAVLMQDLAAVDYDIKNFNEDVQSVRDRIEASGMSDQQKADANLRIDKVVKTMDTSGTEYKPLAVKQLRALMPSLSNEIAQSNSAVAAAERESNDRLVLAAQKVELLAMQEPDRNEVKFRAENLALAADEEWDDLEPEEQADYLEKATRSIKEDMQDLLLRMNIRAGLEQPFDVTAEDAAKISRLISQGADPREIATGLTLEGYDPDQIADAISGKGVTAKQAKQILEEVTVEVERVDGAIYGAQTPMYDVMASRRMRGGKTADPNAPTDDMASRQRAALADPANQWKGIQLTPFVNKLSEARSRQGAGQGFRYPGTAEMLGMGQQIEDYFGPTETRRGRR